jgi:hypothetical protein
MGLLRRCTVREAVCTHNRACAPRVPRAHPRAPYRAPSLLSFACTIDSRRNDAASCASATRRAIFAASRSRAFARNWSRTAARDFDSATASPENVSRTVRSSARKERVTEADGEVLLIVEGRKRPAMYLRGRYERVCVLRSSVRVCVSGGEHTRDGGDEAVRSTFMWKT